MSRYTNWAIALAVLIFFVACNNVKFDRDQSFNKCQNFDQSCESDGRIDMFDYTITIGKGMADILFIDDNSGSMSFEQAKMAPAFNAFINSLGAIDYHIAITTTDISSPSNPPRAGFVQDGRLIEFLPGLKFLSPSTSNAQALFQNSIRRPETLNCEQSNFVNCPSGDERGIVAATRAVLNNEAGFIRPNAHLAVVILSDEDVRSTGFSKPTSGYEPTEEDRAEAFMSVFFGPSAPMKGKSVEVHSIIVRPVVPETGLPDQACKDIQNSQSPNAPGPVFGQFGTEYARLAEMTDGTIGDICASDYTAQVGQIGYSIQNKVKDEKIACRPVHDQVIVTLDPPNPAIGINVDLERNLVVFSEQLPPGTRARFQYNCATL